jgi:GABA permease
MGAILASTVVGFLCVIAAAVSPETVFLVLLNSSGAVILFVYVLICVSEIVLRRRTDPDQLVVKMWLFPWLSILVALGIVAILVQMAFDDDARPQLLESLGAWALVVVLYFVTQRIREREVLAPPIPEPTAAPARVLVLANETVEGRELLDELRSIDRAGRAEYFVCVPANPIDTGTAMYQGAVYMWDATVQAAQERLDRTLAVLASENLEATGELGDYKPLKALADAVERFRPDRLVICTLPEQQSAWLRFDIVDRAREAHGLPVTHVVVQPAAVPA